MDEARVIALFLFYSVVAGVLGALAMALVMRLIARAGWAHADMIAAVGSMLTKSRDSARPVGIFMHAVSGIGFAMIYRVLIIGLGLHNFPDAISAGLGFGVFHGIVVSLMLVWMMAEQHPLEEFRNVSAAVGVSHFAGHVAYGLVVGLITAFAPV